MGQHTDTNNQIRCRIKPYIQPFEYRLALAELEALAGHEPQVLANAVDGLEYVVFSDISASQLAQKLAYWEAVHQDRSVLTTQALREATINVVRNGVALGQIEWLVTLNASSSLPNRRALRY